MEKRWMKRAGVAMVAAAGLAVGLAGGAQADYKPSVKDAVTKVLEEFYSAEQGNKLTLYSMQGLMMNINRAMDANQTVDPEAKGKEPGAKGKK